MKEGEGSISRGIITGSTEDKTNRVANNNFNNIKKEVNA